MVSTQQRRRKAGKIAALRKKGLGPKVARRIANGRQRKKK